MNFFRQKFKEVTLSLGDDLCIVLWGKHYHNCRFIKVTRKGFNILNLDNNRCILPRPVYMKGMGYKEFHTTNPIRGKFTVARHIDIVVKDTKNDKTA
jgi:hypothetical protein